MNQFEMVAIIVVAVMFASVLKARYGYGRRNRGKDDGNQVTAEERAENMRLRDEVKELKERIHVLERITVDKENSLSREIEDLRDR